MCNIHRHYTARNVNCAIVFAVVIGRGVHAISGDMRPRNVTYAMMMGKASGQRAPNGGGTTDMSHIRCVWSAIWVSLLFVCVCNVANVAVDLSGANMRVDNTRALAWLSPKSQRPTHGSAFEPRVLAAGC